MQARMWPVLSICLLHGTRYSHMCVYVKEAFVVEYVLSTIPIVADICGIRTGMCSDVSITASAGTTELAGIPVELPFKGVLSLVSRKLHRM